MKLIRSAAGITGLALAAGLLVSTSTPAQAATGCTASTHVPGDVNGDGQGDLVIGDTAVDNGDGAIDLWLGGTTRQTHTQASCGIKAPTRLFGDTVAVGDIDGDGCADVAVEASGNRPSGEAGSRRSVFLLKGSVDGLSAQGMQRIQIDPRSGEATLAILPGYLVVGQAQELSAEGRGGALSFHAYDHGSLQRPVRVDQDYPGVPGADEDYDEFGFALAVTGSTLVVGVRGEDVGTVGDAGAVALLTVTGPGPSSAAAASPRTRPGSPVRRRRLTASEPRWRPATVGSWSAPPSSGSARWPAPGWCTRSPTTRPPRR